MNARVAMQQAFVLHRKPYRETSLLLEILTPEYGRVGLIARGAKRSKSCVYGLLEPFRPVLISWSGRGELYTLTAVESDESAPRLVGQALINALYLNELLMRLLHRHVPHPGVYWLYRRTLEQLANSGGEAQASSRIEAVLRIFEKHLLHELGYALILEHEGGSGSRIQADAFYMYDPGFGPIRVDGHTRQHTLIVRGASLLALAHEQLQEIDVLREVKMLMRRTLSQHLGERPLNSRRLFKALIHSST